MQNAISSLKSKVRSEDVDPDYDQRRTMLPYYLFIWPIYKYVTSDVVQTAARIARILLTKDAQSICDAIDQSRAFEINAQRFNVLKRVSPSIFNTGIIRFRILW